MRIAVCSPSPHTTAAGATADTEIVSGMERSIAPALTRARISAIDTPSARASELPSPAMRRYEPVVLETAWQLATLTAVFVTRPNMRAMRDSAVLAARCSSRPPHRLERVYNSPQRAQRQHGRRDGGEGEQGDEAHLQPRAGIALPRTQQLGEAQKDHEGQGQDQRQVEP